ncbi:MAG: hypothetical protein ACOYXM_02505 [Actinomycetota bacterium]
MNRTLSARRFVVLVDWVGQDAATPGRVELDDRWRRQGADVWSASLAPLRSKGHWRGATPFVRTAEAEPPNEGAGPVASLTYARIRPTRLGHFYFLGFPRTARRMTGRDSPMLAGVGFGDVPIHHACTFSVWPSATELERIVLGRSEPHGAVVRRSSEQRWLSESMFARFAVVDHAGTWGADDPLN